MGGRSVAKENELKTSEEYMRGKYFILPNEIFSLDLSARAIVVYTYLMRIENRKTNVCWAKQKTIADAVGFKSQKTVAKALEELENKELIYRENMSMDHNGQKVNGIQMFTIRPIDDAIQHKQWMQMEALVRATEIQKTADRITKYNEKHADNPVMICPREKAVF